MNKNLMIVVIGIVLVVLGGLVFLNMSPKSDPGSSVVNKKVFMTGDDKSVDSETKDKQNDETTNPESKRYIEYSNQVFDEAAIGRRVLFFYASWCPTCKPADVNFKDNSASIPEDLTVIRVNYNDLETDAEEKALAKKYGVTYQHTYVQIDKDGKELIKWNGGKLDELLEKTK